VIADPLATVRRSCRRGLRELEQLHAKTQEAPAASEHVRELTLRSLKKRINQFKEEIVRFESSAHSARK
jgi:hypothetical protein